MPTHRVYYFLLSAWQNNSSEISYFSPLNDESPGPECDAIFLPGGYPELHLPALHAAQNFKQSINRAAQDKKAIYAECGGHMVLGQSITGADGEDYAMTGVLPHRTSFARPRMNLGYRQLKLVHGGIFGVAASRFNGHEFHYSQEITQVDERPLFIMTDATGRTLATTGYYRGHVNSSFVHLIDIAKSHSPPAQTHR